MMNRSPGRGGFTTIELLVTIGIIVLLISILIPVVSRVREAAKRADTSAWIAQLSGAIEAYHQDFKAYPGPLSNDQVRGTPATTAGLGFVSPWPTAEYAANSGPTVDGAQRFTMSENLVLGLLGGLRPVLVGSSVQAHYDPSMVGNGPLSLNPAQPKRYAPYIDAQNLSWQVEGGRRTGAFVDDASRPNGADDSIIPEFVDRFSDPLPILYFRAKVGANVTTPPAYTPDRNPVITNDLNFTTGRVGQYDLSQNIGYTRPANTGDGTIGVGKRPGRLYNNGSEIPLPSPIPHGLTNVNIQSVTGPTNNTNYDYPFDAFAYFRDPSLSSPNAGPSGYQPPHVARQKDRYILISAGPDRIYGTSDDITNFGPVP
jgi:type II secretory pathway pseudopilin PulG